MDRNTKRVRCCAQHGELHGIGWTLPASLGEGVLSPNDRLVVARTLDPQTNGGVNAQSTFAFALSNGGDAITLSCGDITVDVLDYAGFPVVPGYSLSLTRDALTEAARRGGKLVRRLRGIRCRHRFWLTR